MGFLNDLGIVAFAVSGALKAFEKRMDLLGVVVLGFSTALAGGIVRDVLLGVYPPGNIREPLYPLLAVAGSLGTLVFRKQLANVSGALLVADALGLGTFTATGAQAGFEHGLNVVGVALVASVTAVGGGVLRDLLSNEIPVVLRRDFYATPTIIGGACYCGFYYTLGQRYALAATFALVVVVRLVALAKKWELPKVGPKQEEKPRV